MYLLSKICFREICLKKWHFPVNFVMRRLPNDEKLSENAEVSAVTCSGQASPYNLVR